MANTLLVVEDNDLNRDMLTRRLKRQGYHVFEARNGEEALTLYSLNQPDAIIMDLELPIRDGWSATRALRSDLACTKPIIALTAHAMPEDRQKALDSGCDEYLTKPVNFAELSAMLRRLISADAP